MGWIFCKDRLPEEAGLYIVYRSDGSVSTECFYPKVVQYSPDVNFEECDFAIGCTDIPADRPYPSINGTRPAWITYTYEREFDGYFEKELNTDDILCWQELPSVPEIRVSIRSPIARWEDKVSIETKVNDIVKKYVDTIPYLISYRINVNGKRTNESDLDKKIADYYDPTISCDTIYVEFVCKMGENP